MNIEIRDGGMEVYGDWPYDPRSDQVRAEMDRDRNRQQQDIEEAWGRMITCQGGMAWNDASEDDIKLLKWALGIRG